MNRNVAYPFFVLPEQVVVAGAWQIALADETPEEAGEYLEDWDYASTVTLTRDISVDFEAAAAALQIPVSELQLEYLFEIGTGPGRLPRQLLKSIRVSIPADGSSLPVVLSLAGSELSAALNLKSSVLLAVAPAEPAPGSPARVGDRLWADELRIRLEGGERRFPLEVTSFRHQFGDVPHASAPWYVNWNTSDWHRDFHGAVRLLINEDQPDFVKQVEKGNSFTLRMILADVIGQIIERMVLEEDADELLAGCEAGTLGGQVRAWTDIVWPGKPLSFVRSLLESCPGQFRAAVLVIAQLPEEQ